MVNEIRHRKKMHLSNFDYANCGHVYFITICTADKRPYFQDYKIAESIVTQIAFRRDKEEIRLFCYCIMPAHVHLLLSLTKVYQKSLINWVSAFKRYSTKNANESHGVSRLWQKNFYDHVIRKEESLNKIAEYILNNPVRKNIVRIWEDYPFSKMVDPLPL